MKRPWQIWLLFLLSLTVVVPALGWVTYKAWQLDQREAIAQAEAVAARRKAELEEDISRALWRMDTYLTPLMAQEAARPWFVYRSAYLGNVGSKSGKVEQRVPSPILVAPEPFVLLHFQLTPGDAFSSPQTPPESLRDFAETHGATAASIQTSQQRLSELAAKLHYQQLALRLPEELIPTALLAELAIKSNFQGIENRAQVQSLEVQNFDQIANAQPSSRLQTTLPPDQQIQFSSTQDRLSPTGQGVLPSSGENPAPQPVQIDQPRAPDTAPQRLQPALMASNDYGRYQAARSVMDQQERGSADFARRNQAFQSYGQNEVVQQRAFNEVTPETTSWSEGVSQPLWIDGRLILARRAVAGAETIVQGCWINWDAVQAALLAEVVDLLPEAQLLPVRAEESPDPSRMLATLPVRLVVPDPLSAALAQIEPIAATQFSPMRVSLALAWLCLLLATAAVAMLLLGVVSLSERRGAFVSAVTHELRTPLTTFRMYAEMLSEGMVSDEQQQQAYLQTLRGEADRLSHLVENVLSYARLERGRRGGRREVISLASLLELSQSRLADRARQAEMDLFVDCGEQELASQLSTDPAAVEQILFNLVDNSCKYARDAEDRRIELTASLAAHCCRLHLTDHGPGLSSQASRRLFQPFSKSDRDAAHSAPGVGLGLALCRRLAKDLGGQLLLDRSTDQGATFTLELPLA